MAKIDLDACFRKVHGSMGQNLMALDDYCDILAANMKPNKSLIIALKAEFMYKVGLNEGEANALYKHMQKASAADRECFRLAFRTGLNLDLF